ncbi:hypothetical protein SDA16_13545 [Legionella pneumophila serogroup 1]|uniref:hypothetical protein n=1 Tax=Legionella pneumophila TaxID=446 RepID=UPI0007786EA0|nr:hypothetical protein [Legionella pneumophila]HAT8623320.1 hypothetical protein [Legionella pneumophila]HAU1410295.1 hypothetical protein [Legionella pneumophila]HCC3170275.1 hypothetical protein [Legionella pneumophila]HCC3179505.1 hypothetical protein [Legionella pneumophila]HCC3185455.1 hypothetical protein [Legionella pneumophila]
MNWCQCWQEYYNNLRSKNFNDCLRSQSYDVPYWNDRWIIGSIHMFIADVLDITSFGIIK